MPRKTWADRKAAVMAPVLDEAGLTGHHDEMVKLLNERVSLVAARLGITETTARQSYFDDDQVRNLAKNIVEETGEVSSTEPPSPAVLAAAATLLDTLKAHSEAGEATQPHSIVVRDPETDRWEVFGPWPTRVEARVAQLLLRERHMRDDPEFENFEYHVALTYPTTEII